MLNLFSVGARGDINLFWSFLFRDPRGALTKNGLEEPAGIIIYTMTNTLCILVLCRLGHGRQPTSRSSLNSPLPSTHLATTIQVPYKCYTGKNRAISCKSYIVVHTRTLSFIDVSNRKQPHMTLGHQCTLLTQGRGSIKIVEKRTNSYIGVYNRAQAPIDVHCGARIVHDGVY